MTKIRNKLKHSKNVLMKFSHNIYLGLRKLPSTLRYTFAIALLIIGGVFMTNPLLPGWLLITIGIGIFLPGIQYKYIGKHFKAESIRKVEHDIAVNIEHALQTNPRWYHRYKFRMRKIWKRFK